MYCHDLRLDTEIVPPQQCRLRSALSRTIPGGYLQYYNVFVEEYAPLQTSGTTILTYEKHIRL